MVRRAERPGDPWSGDMAFPGGRWQPEDRSHIDTALRELEEETGVSIRKKPDYSLPPLWTKSHNTLRPMAIHPFVFSSRKIRHFQLSHELTDAVWIPLNVFEAPASVFSWKLRYARFQMPCYYYREFRVWGLSLKMIRILRNLPGFASQQPK